MQTLTVKSLPPFKIQIQALAGSDLVNLIPVQNVGLQLVMKFKLKTYDCIRLE